jgi:hypothetical protein
VVLVARESEALVGHTGLTLLAADPVALAGRLESDWVTEDTNETRGEDLRVFIKALQI